MTPEQKQIVEDEAEFRQGFAALLRWVGSDVREDALSDESLSGMNYDDSYLGDMSAIRSARRRLMELKR